MTTTCDSFGYAPTLNPRTGLYEYLTTQQTIQRFHTQGTTYTLQDETPEIIQPAPVSLLDREVSVFYSLADLSKKKGKPYDFNCFWCKTLTVRQVCELIKSGKFRRETEALREIPRDSPENKQYKSRHFAYVCWSGTFSYRDAKSLILHSGLICLDLDHLDSDLDQVRTLVNADPATVISFVSPNADGLKIVYEIDTAVCNQAEWYELLTDRINRRCGLPPKKVDPACKDVSRPCFLPFDNYIYIINSAA